MDLQNKAKTGCILLKDSHGAAPGKENTQPVPPLPSTSSLMDESRRSTRKVLILPSNHLSDICNCVAPAVPSQAAQQMQSLALSTQANIHTTEAALFPFLLSLSLCFAQDPACIRNFSIFPAHAERERGREKDTSTHTLSHIHSRTHAHALTQTGFCS